MPKDLAALLLEDGAVSAEALARAHARQGEAGGALDTALLEVGAIAEDVLLEGLARAADLPAAPASAWSADDARARRVFPSRVAERHGLAPFALEGRELSLVATYPVDLELLDEISFMLSLHLTPHVGPEWRVRELIHRLYGTPLSARHAALARSAGAPAGPPAEASAPPEPQPPPPAAAAALAGFEREGAEPNEPLAAALQQALDSIEASAFEEARGAGYAEEPEPEGPPPDRSAPPRWSLADARAALAAASRRDEVVLAALRYARDFFEYAAVFAVTRDAVAGHDALGVEGDRDRARGVAIYVSDPGIFRTVIETRSPYLGPVSRDAPGNAAILDGLGRATPRTVLVHPVLLRDRPVCILYADNGEAPVSPRRLGDLLLLLSTTGAAFERIIRDRKARRGRPAPAAAQAPPAPREVVVPEGLPALDLSVVEPPAPAAAAGSFGGGPSTDALPALDLAEASAPAAPEPVDAAPAPVPAALSVQAETLAGLEAQLLAGAVAGPVAAQAAPAVSEAARDGAAPTAAQAPAAGPAGGAAGPEALSPGALADRVLDPDPAASADACAELGRRRRDPAVRPASEKLRRALLSGLSGRAARAARALGALRDVDAIPLLIQVLEAGDAETARAAADALAAITLQRLGTDARGWLGWWKQNRGRGRAEWLFSGLTSADRETRVAASAELSLAAPPPVPYSADATPPERERVARAWAGWWARSGQVL